MKEIIKKIRVYDVEDLKLKENKLLKDKVMKLHGDINVDHEYWNDFIEEQFIDKLKSKGFYDIKPYYRLAFSQGDGASCDCRIDFKDALKLTGNNLSKIEQWCMNNDLVEIDTIVFYVNGHYYHENEIRCEEPEPQLYFDYILKPYSLDFLRQFKLETLYLSKEMEREFEDIAYMAFQYSISKVTNETLVYLKEQCRKYYRELHDYYLQATDEDAVFETFSIHGYWFNESGDIEDLTDKSVIIKEA